MMSSTTRSNGSLLARRSASVPSHGAECGEPFELQVEQDQIANVRVVFDDEHAGPRGGAGRVGGGHGSSVAAWMVTDEVQARCHDFFTSGCVRYSRALPSSPSQHLHRIDVGGPAGGDIAGQGGHRQEQEGDLGERAWIVGRQPVEELPGAPWQTRTHTADRPQGRRPQFSAIARRPARRCRAAERRGRSGRRSRVPLRDVIGQHAEETRHRRSPAPARRMCRAARRRGAALRGSPKSTRPASARIRQEPRDLPDARSIATSAPQPADRIPIARRRNVRLVERLLRRLK